MGWTALYQHAMEGKVDAITDEIYKNGTIVNDTTELTGMSPLHKACQYGQVRAVEELIKEEANVTAVNDWGCTCLHWTVKGSVHNQKDKSYQEDDYIQIIHALVGQSKKLLDMKSKQGKVPPETPSQMAKRLNASKIQKELEQMEEKEKLTRKDAEEKKIRNKPKVRRV